MERHVNLLGLLASIWGALAVLIGTSMLLLSAGALAQLLDVTGPTTPIAARVTAGVFALVGVVALLWGGGHLWAARLLRQRRPMGRMVALGLAVVNVLVLPFGTALGVYAMWVLLTTDGHRLFDAGVTMHPDGKIG